MTLTESLKNYSPKRMMYATIKHAIDIYGGETECVISSGLLSYNVRSKAHKAALAAKIDAYIILTGARAGRRATEGYELLIINVSLHPTQL